MEWDAVSTFVGGGSYAWEVPCGGMGGEEEEVEEGGGQGGC